MSQWIPVLVRAEDYDEVTAMVARREAERAHEDTAATQATGAPVAEVGTVETGPGSRPSKADAALAAYPAWPEDAMRRLALSDVVTAQRWVRALDACADTPDDDPWLTTTQVAERSGMSVTEWRDAPRKISRHLKANYRELPTWHGHLAWPLLAWGISRGSEVSWAMTPEAKARWRTVRGSALEDEVLVGR